MPEVWRSKYDFSLDVVFMVNLHGMKRRHTSPTLRGKVRNPAWVDKAKASPPETAVAARGWMRCELARSRSRGTAPQPRRPMVAWRIADNVSRHGSAAWPGLRARGSNQSASGASLVPRRQAPA